WLALREPADKAARDAGLLNMLAQTLRDGNPEGKRPPNLLDIGCGTGSTYRTLSPLLPKNTRWRLLDFDPALLAEASARIGEDSPVEFSQFDLNNIDALPLAGTDVVTASALFDLCSANFCDRFVGVLAPTGAGLYAALNYDGQMVWSVVHPLDAAVTADFNRHQRLDKGFGAALGPDSTHHLAGALSAFHYRVLTAESPWVLDERSAPLQRELLEGIAIAVREIGELIPEKIEAWLTFRLEQADVPGSLCRIGHQDLLALPG
ncbi:class I SAM-dependent methyltransferase, partial [Rhizobium sp. AAP43]|uniref:class I SAM-dependent methyltransferase n=1 Tax=Rhizobium sp. AAP43 TaxID=1523420 RepID=UPI0009EBFAB4